MYTALCAIADLHHGTSQSCWNVSCQMLCLTQYVASDLHLLQGTIAQARFALHPREPAAYTTQHSCLDTRTYICAHVACQLINQSLFKSVLPAWLGWLNGYISRASMKTAKIIIMIWSMRRNQETTKEQDSSCLVLLNVPLVRHAK